MTSAVPPPSPAPVRQDHAASRIGWLPTPTPTPTPTTPLPVRARSLPGRWPEVGAVDAGEGLAAGLRAAGAAARAVDARPLEGEAAEDATARDSSGRAGEPLGSSASSVPGEVAHCDCLNPLAAARVRLFGFHDAGGSATRFVPFCRLGSDGVEIHTVANTRGRLPEGAGERYLEQVVGYIRSRSELPYVLFGHSLGGLFAWRVLKALQQTGVPLPRLLVLSAAATPPALERARSAEGLSELFSRVGGERLRALKSLRADFEADFALWWALPATEGAPVDVEILAFAGRDDAVAGAQAMRVWEQATTAEFSLSELPGGHFYIIAEAGRVAMLDALAQKLRQL
jgi:surfactin synthase thioesterase subunit